MQGTKDGSTRYLGSSIDSGRRANRTWSPGRVCEVDGCRTRLSIYNRVGACSVHEEARTYVVRGRRRSARREGVRPSLA